MENFEQNGGVGHHNHILQSPGK